MWRGLVVAALMLAGNVPADGAYAKQGSAESNQAQPAPPQPQSYYSPCGRDDEDRNSDLCAQWKSADWARKSYLIGFIGVVGLVITLLFNLEAWNRARKAEGDTQTALGHAETSAKAATDLAATAEKTARHELRAYLDFDGVRILRWPKRDKPGTPGVSVKAVTCIKNYGRTPAENMQVTTTNYIKGDTKSGIQKIPFTVEDRIDFDYVAPTDNVTHQAYWNMPTQIWEALERQKITLVIALIVTYTDVFEKPHVLRSDFESLDIDEDFGFVRGTRKAT
jgi:hypothetical protein